VTDSGKRKSIANIDRLRRLMDEQALDALIIRSGINFTYLAGFAYAGTNARHLDFADSPRPVFVIWPRHGEPVLVLNAGAEPVARRDSWIEKIELYASYVEPPLIKVANVLRALGLGDGRVGFEDAYFSFSQYTALTSDLPRLTLVECTQLMEQVRSIKTPGEIALIKRAAEILDNAFLEVFSTLRVGETERDAHSRMVAACLRDGAMFAHGWMVCSRNTVHGGGQGDVPFLKGDVVRTDYVSYIDGYPGHQSRNAVLGTPTAGQRDAYRRLRDVYLALADQCRPGVTAGALHGFVGERFAAQGWPFRAALVGHSIGTWWHQQEPIFAQGATTPLEAGMVIALEPTVGEWITQDLFLVTNDGAQLLSDKFNTEEVYVIGAD
jgi:Xaa-Pro aminopeptidase